VKKIIICGAVIALCFACGGDEGDGAILIFAGPTEPACGPGNLIAFGGEDVFYCDEYGKNLTRVTNTPQIRENHPRWAPDGNYIAYDAFDAETGRTEIYTILKTGGNAFRLTDTGGSFPDWSPNGETITYVNTGTYDIYKITALGGIPKRLTTTGRFYQPHWTADGERILFCGPDPKAPQGPFALWSVPREGGKITKVVKGMTAFYWFDIAPAGEWSALVFETETGPRDVWLVELKTGYKFRLTDEPEDKDRYPLGACSPTWSENGDVIFFGSDRYDAGIYKIEVKK
jgi:Tol biopolymer transport system component